MKIRDAVFLVIGGLLVISGMVLNSFLVGDADAQSSSLGDMDFGVITCNAIRIKDDGNKLKGYFGLNGEFEAILQIYGDNGESSYVAYLGSGLGNEMVFQLKSKSKTDKREASMMIDENGGRLNCNNKMGKRVAVIGVGNDGGGVVDLRDKHGYTR